MQPGKSQNVETIQRMIARTVATHPSGRNLMLIGGFRYRLLDRSARMSNDIDYHWEGDLDQKQFDLFNLFNRVVLSEVRRLLQYDGNAAPAHGPDADSPRVRIINLAFWREGVPRSRIEIPVEITRIIRADPVTIRTVEGTVYATVSDADMIESKLIAILNRTILKHRDIVDVFLFQNRFTPESKQRLQDKIQTLAIPPEKLEKRISDLQTHHDYHVRAIQTVMDTQLAAASATQLNDAGGGEIILTFVLEILKGCFENREIE